MRRYSFCIAILILLISCSDRNTTGPEGKYDFALFSLANDTLRTYEAMQQGITELKLESEPWFSADDIEFYDFSSHCIYLKTDKRDFFDCYDEGRFDPFMDKPFVVVASGIRCYIGSIQNSSGLLIPFPPGPFMDEMDVWFYPRDVLHISRARFTEEDIRSKDHIREALSVLHLYHCGLDLRLDAVSVIENADTSTVQYTYTISNHDHDNLLVLDPYLMGSARFHLSMSGVVFWCKDTSTLWSEYREPIQLDPFENWEAEWFTTIRAGESLQRTVQLRGYPRIPAGSYDCSFKFSNPIKIEKEDRYSFSARYWLGGITSKKIVIVVS